LKRLDDALERRTHARVRCPLDCSLLIGGRSHRGLLKDASPTALLVETDGELPPSRDAIVVLHHGGGRRLVLEAAIPFRRTAPRSLAGVTGDALVLRLIDPPAAYLTWVEAETRGARP